MNKAERERRHQARLEQIGQVLVVCGTGDRARPDHEGTLFERARLMSQEYGSFNATENGIDAFDRLLAHAEQYRGTESDEIAHFVDAIWNGKALPLLLLRGHNAAIADDMLAVLDAWRHARLNLVENVKGGPRRVSSLVRRRLQRAGT